MSPQLLQGHVGLAGFPRVSGDEPAPDAVKALQETFSPREWG